MEAAGIAPASREASVTASTCVADHLIVGLGAPVGRVPFGLSRHEFNPSRNRRLGSGDPALASPAGSSGRRRAARPLLFFRQRDGEQQCLLAVKVLVGFLRGLLTNLGTPPITSESGRSWFAPDCQRTGSETASRPPTSSLFVYDRGQARSSRPGSRSSPRAAWPGRCRAWRPAS